MKEKLVKKLIMTMLHLKKFGQIEKKKKKKCLTFQLMLNESEKKHSSHQTNSALNIINTTNLITFAFLPVYLLSSFSFIILPVLFIFSLLSIAKLYITHFSKISLLFIYIILSPCLCLSMN